jgi:hypothetical protein
MNKKAIIMSKVRRCLICDNVIPNTLKKSAKYCSKAHSYEAKKIGVRKRYYEMKKPHDEIKRNEAILSSLYWVQKTLKKQLTNDDLEKSNFNFGFSTEQMTGDHGELWTIVGSYGYYIDPKTKLLTTWKKP